MFFLFHDLSTRNYSDKYRCRKATFYTPLSDLSFVESNSYMFWSKVHLVCMDYVFVQWSALFNTVHHDLDIVGEKRDAAERSVTCRHSFHLDISHRNKSVKTQSLTQLCRSLKAFRLPFRKHSRAAAAAAAAVFSTVSHNF